MMMKLPVTLISVHKKRRCDASSADLSENENAAKRKAVSAPDVKAPVTDVREDKALADVREEHKALAPECGAKQVSLRRLDGFFYLYCAAVCITFV